MKDYKLSKSKSKANHGLIYFCPNCRRSMRRNVVLSEPFNWWSCDKCKKTYELCFRELVPK